MQRATGLTTTDKLTAIRKDIASAMLGLDSLIAEIQAKEGHVAQGEPAKAQRAPAATLLLDGLPWREFKSPKMQRREWTYADEAIKAGIDTKSPLPAGYELNDKFLSRPKKP